MKFNFRPYVPTREDIEKSSLPEAMPLLLKRVGALFSWRRALHRWRAHRTSGARPWCFQSTDINLALLVETLPGSEREAISEIDARRSYSSILPSRFSTRRLWTPLDRTNA